MTQFRLPFPPSVNRFWMTPRSGPLAGRKVLTKDARHYKKRALAAILEQRVPRCGLACSMELRIKVHEPNRIRRDLSNLVKIVEDSLVSAEVIADDFHIDRLTIERAGLMVDGGLTVTIQRLGAERAKQEEIVLEMAI